MKFLYFYLEIGLEGEQGNLEEWEQPGQRELMPAQKVKVSLPSAEQGEQSFDCPIN